MNYIVDHFDFNLLQFGPAIVRMEELSLRQTASLLSQEKFFWLRANRIKAALAAKDVLQFLTISDCESPDIVGFNKEDQVMVIIETVDSHLLVGQTGFRYFILRFQLRELDLRFMVGDAEVPIVKALE